jgi:hypothetical protein
LASIRQHLTYANVVSTICLFLALGGATAFAAKQLARNSVGAKQLKKNAVTAVKIKNGAVRGPKLADRSVTGGKLADGSVTARKLAPGVIPGLPIVRHLGGASTLEFPPSPGPAIDYPLDNPTFTQAAGEVDLLVASIAVHIPASCTGSRFAEARLFMDTGRGRSADEQIGKTVASDGKAGEELLIAHFVGGENTHGPAISAPSSATAHTFSVRLDRSSCNGNGGPTPTGITVTGVEIDVIGFR